jgi:hypothetical protein
MDFDDFISHSVKDKPTADAACAVLERSGIRCWIAPRDIRAGGEYAAAIIDAIGRCRVMVLIFSSSSNDSVQIRREIERAVSKGVPIVPVRIEEVVPTKSMEYFLGSIHWLDALTPPIEQHLQRLAETVKAILNVDVAAHPGSVADNGSLANALGKSNRFARADGNWPQAEHVSKPTPRPRWIMPAVAGLSMALLAVALFFYYSNASRPSQPLGSPIDGWTTSGGAILRFYPRDSAEGCRSDCEKEGVGCFAYDWVKPGGYKPGDSAMCYLKQWYDGITKSPCCITANRGGTRPR